MGGLWGDAGGRGMFCLAVGGLAASQGPFACKPQPKPQCVTGCTEPLKHPSSTPQTPLRHPSNTPQHSSNTPQNRRRNPSQPPQNPLSSPASALQAGYWLKPKPGQMRHPSKPLKNPQTPLVYLQAGCWLKPKPA